jgi:hypothetical protein
MSTSGNRRFSFFEREKPPVSPVVPTESTTLTRGAVAADFVLLTRRGETATGERP